MVGRTFIVMLGIGAMSAADGCARCRSSDFGKGQSVPEQTIEQVQEEHTDEWMAIPGVEGTALGLSKDKPCILILSSVKAQQLRDKIPPMVQGHPVIIKETGTFRALEQ